MCSRYLQSVVGALGLNVSGGHLANLAAQVSYATDQSMLCLPIQTAK